MDIAGVLGGRRGSGDVGNEVVGRWYKLAVWLVRCCRCFGKWDHPQAGAGALVPADNSPSAIRDGAANLGEIDVASGIAKGHGRDQ